MNNTLRMSLRKFGIFSGLFSVILMIVFWDDFSTKIPMFVYIGICFGLFLSSVIIKGEK